MAAVCDSDRTYDSRYFFGLIAFVIPGVILIARLSFASFELVFHDRNVMDAFKQSWEATKGLTGTLLQGYLVIACALYLPLILLSQLYDVETAAGTAISTLFSILYSVLDALFVIYTFRVYGFAQRNTYQG